MSLSRHLTSWSGDAFRHVPAAAPFAVLDFRFAGRSADNRWNDPGQPTLYLAGDEGVLIAEWGRHFAVNRTTQLKHATVKRDVYSLTLSLAKVIDLRDDAVWDDLSLANAPHCFLEMNVSRAVAGFVRQTTAAQAMLVPSMGFLDHLDRWCLVLFLEKLPEVNRYITAVTHRGPLRWG